MRGRGVGSASVPTKSDVRADPDQAGAEARPTSNFKGDYLLLV